MNQNETHGDNCEPESWKKWYKMYTWEYKYSHIIQFLSNACSMVPLHACRAPYHFRLMHTIVHNFLFIILGWYWLLDRVLWCPTFLVFWRPPLDENIVFYQVPLVCFSYIFFHTCFSFCFLWVCPLSVEVWGPSEIVWIWAPGLKHDAAIRASGESTSRELVFPALTSVVPPLRQEYGCAASVRRHCEVVVTVMGQCMDLSTSWALSYFLLLLQGGNNGAAVELGDRHSTKGVN